MFSSLNLLQNNPLGNMAMNLASTIAFPQTAIAGAVTNLFVGALGGGVNGAMDTLTKEHGMPKFLGDMVKNEAGNALPQFMNPVSQECCDAVKDKVGDKIDQYMNDFLRDLVDETVKNKEGEDKKAGGKGGGKGWFVALMVAIGELQNKQAEKLDKLQGEVSESLTGSGASKSERQAEFDKMEEFKAEAKLQEALASLAKTIGDAIGNALNAVARPQ